MKNKLVIAMFFLIWFVETNYPYDIVIENVHEDIEKYGK